MGKVQPPLGVFEGIADGEETVSELARTREVDFVDLPGGHWPQLGLPDQLARIILDGARSRR